jgi:molybdopterin synthase sulfur carrier subunit
MVIYDGRCRLCLAWRQVADYSELGKFFRRFVMSVRVRVPTPLRKFTQGADEVNAQGNNVKSIVDDLEKSYPGIKERICDETGKVRRFVNVYVNGDDIRFLQNMDTALKEGDNISIVPAIAGGR